MVEESADKSFDIIAFWSEIWGLLKKKPAACSSAAKDPGGQAARKLGHAVTRDSAVSSRQMFLRNTQEESGDCQEQIQAKTVTKKRRRGLRIFSAHITRNPIEIEVSAPLVSRDMISRSECFRFPDPNTPSASVLFRWSALSCCL